MSGGEHTLTFRHRDAGIAVLLAFTIGAAFGDGGGSWLREVWRTSPPPVYYPVLNSYPVSGSGVEFVTSDSRVTWVSRDTFRCPMLLTSSGLAIVVSGRASVYFEGAAYLASDGKVIIPVPTETKAPR